MGDNIHSTDLLRLTKSNVLDHDHSTSVVTDFLQSAAYSAAEAPARAMAQAVDHFKGGNAADTAVQSGFKSVGVEAPKQAQFGTSHWYAQQLGGAVGMVVPFMALRAGVNVGANRLLGEAGAAQTLTQMAMREAAVSGTTGLVYGSVFSPSNESNVNNSNFYSDRLKSGLSNMASFAALGFTAPYIGAGLDSAAGALERSSLTALPKSTLATALRFPAVTGMAAGVPGGIVNAETNAWKDGRSFATSQELKESIIGMSFVGGAMGTASWVIDKAQNSMKQEAADAAKGRVAPEQMAAKDKSETVIGETPEDIALVRAIQEALRRQGKDASPEAATQEMQLLNKLADSTVERSGAATAKAVNDESASPKITDKIKPTDPNLPGLDIVLGASGIEAPAHAGFLQAIEDNHVPVKDIIGASGGSLVAALYANHYTPTQIRNILLSDQFRYPKMSVMADCFHVTDPWNLYPYSIDFKPWVKDFVDTYHLKPQPNLKIVAADAKTRAPVVFQGTDYDLTTALTASTASTIGMNMKPVQYQGRQLIDGFYYHPIPAAVGTAPAIVSKIGFVSKLPSELLTPWDYWMHLRELSYHDELTNKYPDPPGNIIAETGLPDVATTTFSVSKETLEKLVQHGYDTTMERLQQPDAQKAIAEAQHKPIEAVSKK